MSRIFTIDTNILEIAQDMDNRLFQSAVSLIFNMYNKCNKVAYNKKIMDEYRVHIHERFIQKWFTDNFRMNKFYYINCSPLDKKLRDKLNKFDPDDIKFIEVAKSCPNKIIITEDSDFDDGVKLILKEINIDVWTIKQALEELET